MCSAVEVVSSVRLVLFARLSVVSVGGRRFLQSVCFLHSTYEDVAVDSYQQFVSSQCRRTSTASHHDASSFASCDCVLSVSLSLVRSTGVNH